MIFNSFTYVFFLTAVTLVCRLLPRRPRHLFLFAASITFYGFWRFDYVLIMLASAFTDFFAAINIHAAKAPAKRRLWLALNLAVNFGLLFYFKYATFIVGNVNGLAHLLGREDLLATWSVVLPVGISFYTFQTVSYTVDVYARAHRADPRAAALRPVRHLFRASRRRADPARRRGHPAARPPQAVRSRVPRLRPVADPQRPVSQMRARRQHRRLRRRGLRRQHRDAVGDRRVGAGHAVRLPDLSISPPTARSRSARPA